MFAKRAGMNVILRVTGHAVFTQATQVALTAVATLAFNACMTAGQRKGRLRMVAVVNDDVHVTEWHVGMQKTFGSARHMGFVVVPHVTDRPVEVNRIMAAGALSVRANAVRVSVAIGTMVIFALKG